MSSVGKHWELEFSPVQGYVTEARLGDIVTFNFTARVVKREQLGDGFGGGTTTPTFVPPKPKIIDAYISDHFKGATRDIDITDSLVTIRISDIDTVQYFPFKKIVYQKDDVEYEVGYTAELYDANKNPVFDVVTSYVPSDLNSIVEVFDIVVTTSAEDVHKSQDYTIKIANDWNRSKLELEKIMETGQEFIKEKTPPTIPLLPITVPTNKVEDESPDGSKAKEPEKPAKVPEDSEEDEEKPKLSTVDSAVKFAKDNKKMLITGGGALVAGLVGKKSKKSKVPIAAMITLVTSNHEVVFEKGSALYNKLVGGKVIDPEEEAALAAEAELNGEPAPISLNPNELTAEDELLETPPLSTSGDPASDEAEQDEKDSEDEEEDGKKRKKPPLFSVDGLKKVANDNKGIIKMGGSLLASIVK